MATGPTVTVRVHRAYDLPPERVFDAWLDPALIEKWMFGAVVRDEEIVRATVDPRVGGRFSFVVRRQGKEIDHVGGYLDIDRPRRLAFTWGTADTLPDTSRVTIDIVARDGGCALTLTHDMDSKWAEYAERTEAGWRKMLEALEKVGLVGPETRKASP
jgi:uncharacterized protein YndB with AHSA1/START domain